MTGRTALIGLATALCAPLLLPGAAAAQNASVEITQETINRVATRLGAASESGVYQPTHVLELPGFFDECVFYGFLECPGFPGFPGARIPLARCWKTGGGVYLVPAGAPVTWQWWVEGAEFLLESGQMRFSASVRWRVGEESGVSGPFTVDAAVGFSAATDRLSVNVAALSVPIQAQFGGQTQTVTTVDVAKLHSLSIPIELQTMTVQLPNGGTCTIAPRVLSAAPTYQAGKVTIGLDLDF